ncbi:hypothetical protein JCM17846_24990 [Iodidimonas nitroreducens]|uniref:Ice-binding protein C-terminal domain-containing protein n=1 Tax=Iodidimonas nitroreducens TaxID=1236968 RepID=A0A5A7NA66_9PROT|nr:PEP-CTERM sorting domain-containing protein [Iodidimonas nitroreducens]GAK32222.1 hypothetical protein AQ1_00086 [alpha proteobacterium Q-1]GER04817.1 hypothetical protein JCM17846_24990 [Iodidimonas nitroreducens]
MLKKIAQLGVPALLLASLSVGSAHALPRSVFDFGGSTVFEDDSGEFVLRQQQDGSFAPVLGEIQIGDIFGGVIDISSIGGTALDTLNTEITGVFLTQVRGISNIGTSQVQTTAGSESFASGTIDFEAVDPTFFSTILGIAEPVAAGTATILYEDTDNDFSFFANDITDIAGSIATAVDGNRFLSTVFAADSMFQSNGVPLNTTTFGGVGITGNPIAGVSELGSFFFNLDVGQYFGPGFLLSNKVFGSGSLQFPTTQNGGNVFPVQDDLQFSIQVPVPATLGFMGLGLLSLGLIGRRRKSI